MFGGVVIIHVKCTKLAEFLFKKTPPSQKLFDSSMIRIFLNYVSKFKFFRMLKDSIFIPLLTPNFKCV